METEPAGHDCGQCDYKYTSMKDLMAHIKDSPDHLPQCVPCGAKFGGFTNYGHHVRKFHLKSSSEYVCVECGKVSKTEEQNTQHFNFVHKTEADLYCNICGRECQNMFKLRKHTKTCLKRDPVQVALERQTNESSIPKLAELVQVWTEEQYNSWKQDQFNKIVKRELEKTAKKSPYKRKLNAKDSSDTPEKKKKKLTKPKKEAVKPELPVKPELDDDKDDDLKGAEGLLKRNDSDNKSDSDNDNNDISESFEDHFRDESFEENSHWQDGSDDDYDDVKVEVQVKEELPSDDEDEDYHDTADSNTSVKIKKDDVKEEAKDERIETKPKVKKPRRMFEVDQDGNFKCPEDGCSEVFSKKQSLSNHIFNVHRNGELRTCPLCSKEVKFLTAHMKSVHSQDESWQCDKCSSTFKKEKYLKVHEKRVHHGGGEDSPFKMCPICAKQVKHLTHHMENVHPNEDAFHPCQDCEMTFKSRKYLRQHINSHHSLKMCPVCAKEVKHLSSHMNTVHNEGGLLQCSQCDSTFKSPKYLKQHEKMVHHSDGKDNNPFKMCPICAKEVKHLSTHIRDAHPKDGEIYPCPDCGIILKSKRYLKHHVDLKHNHEGKIMCTICNKLVNKHHMYTAHGTEHMCEICSKTFKTKHALNGHRSRIHSEKGIFPCPECGSVFDQAHKLYGHRYAVHNLIDAKCEFCGGNYKNKKLLQAHKRVSHPELLERSIKAQQMQEMNEFRFRNLSQNLVSPPPTSSYQHLQQSGVS